MKCVFQVVRRADGVRCPVAESTREVYASVLRRMVEEHPDQLQLDDYVIVLFESLDDEGNARFSQAPMMTVEHFLQFDVQGVAA